MKRKIATTDLSHSVSKAHSVTIFVVRILADSLSGKLLFASATTKHSKIKSDSVSNIGDGSTWNTNPSLYLEKESIIFEPLI